MSDESGVNYQSGEGITIIIREINHASNVSRGGLPFVRKMAAVSGYVRFLEI